MKTESSNYIDQANLSTLQPRYVLALSFDDDNTDITYITSHADCLDPGGVAAIDRIDGALQPDGISGQTQRIAPENAQHTIGSVSFKILDVAGKLTTKINTKLTNGEGLRHKRVRLYKGFEGLTSWDDYALRLTYRVEDVQYMDGVYTLSTGDIQRQAKTKIFEPHQGVLTSTLTASATTVPITIANAQDKFPLVYHDAKWDAHINQAVGYIQIDDEIIAHSGWTDATYTALTVVERGALGTVAVEHEVTATEEDQKKKVDEYIYLQMQSPRMAYALLTGLDVPATNLISDVAKFSEFTETGSGVLVETADVGPVPWVNWFDVIDDAATYETADYTITDFTVNQIYTASVAIKNDATKTKNLYLRITFFGATAGSYAEIRLKMSTGVTTSTTTAADATTVSTDAELINGFWVLRVSASCSNPSTSSIRVSIFPAVDIGGAAETQTIQAALPFLAIGEHAGMYPLPEHWHLGIHADYTRLADFTGIGADLWDTTNNTGRVARFMGLDGDTGKAFIEKELLLWMGAYMPVHADGTLGLRRLKSVLPYAGYDAYLDSTQIIRYGALQYDQSAVINDISIAWNWIDTLDRYTKTTRLYDTQSINKHGTAAQKTYEFRGVFNGVHTDSDLQNYFENIRDRYSAPPLRLQIDVMPQWDKIEVGDTVRVDLSQHVDYHIDDTLSRTFEVQQVRTDWITGKVSLTLFGGVEAAAQDAIATSFVLSDTFYGSSGSLGGTDLASVLTISAGAITANGSLTGGDYYYDGGDLTLNSGVTVTISGTVRLRVKGFFTVNGSIDGTGGGAAGGAGGTITNGSYTPSTIIAAYRANRPTPGTAGAYGSNTPSVSSFRNERTSDGVEQARAQSFFTLLDVPTVGKTSAGVVNIINQDGLTINGISEIDDLTGSGGGGSAAAFDLVMGAGTWPVTQLSAGAAGGAGGAGFCLIARGMSFGASGSIDVSGAAGTAGGSGVSGGDTFYAASGTSGWPGAVYILLDGDVATPDTSKIITKTGNSSIPAASQFLTRTNFATALTASNDTYALSFFGSAIYDHPNNSHRDQLRIQYIPRALNGFTWYPAQEARQVTGYENKPAEWDQIADSAGLKPANNATVGADYEANLANKPTEADNLVLKSAFEDNSAGSWDAATGTVVSVVGQDFSKAYRFQEHKAQHPSSEFIVEAGEVLYLSASANAASASYNVYASLEFKDSAGSTVSTTDVLTWTTGAGWSAKSGSVTVPATAKTAVPTFKINTTAPGGATGTAEMTQFRVTRAEPGATVGAIAGSNLRDSALNSVGDADFLNSALIHTADLTVTVGSGGDYSTISAAIEGVSRRFPSAQQNGLTVEINILSGFTAAEAVIIRRGMQLGWIVITGVDSSTGVDATAITSTNFTYSTSSGRAFFIVEPGAVAPQIDHLFVGVFDATYHALLHGMAAYGSGSSITINSGKGFAYFGRDEILAVDNAVVNAPGCVVKDPGGLGSSRIVADTGGLINAPTIEVDSILCKRGGKVIADGCTLGALAGGRATVESDGVLSMENATAPAKTTMPNPAILLQVNSNGSVDMDNFTIGDTTAWQTIINNSGGTVSADSVAMSGTSSTSVIVAKGGIVRCVGSTGTLSQTANTVAAAGIIFR